MRRISVIYLFWTCLKQKYFFSSLSPSLLQKMPKLSWKRSLFYAYFLISSYKINVKWLFRSISTIVLKIKYLAQSKQKISIGQVFFRISANISLHDWFNFKIKLSKYRHGLTLPISHSTFIQLFFKTHKFKHFRCNIFHVFQHSADLGTGSRAQCASG